jgi:hypothetical protein
MSAKRDNPAVRGTPRGEIDHTQIENDDWADRYLMGLLSDDERQRYEEHFVTCPRCLDDLESLDGLRNGLRNLPQSETAPKPQAAAHHLPWWLLAAAGLIVGFGLAAWIFVSEVGRTRRDLAASNAAAARMKQSDAALQKDLQSARALASPSGASVFTLDRTRGGPAAEPENRILLPKDSGWVVLQFGRPPVPQEAGYAVRISGAEGRPIGDPVKLSPFSTDTLTLTLPPGLLQAGDYTLSVEATSAPEVSLTTYRFRVVAPR